MAESNDDIVVDDSPVLRTFGQTEETGRAGMDPLDVLLSADSGRVTDVIRVHKRKGLPADLDLTIGSLTDREFKECATQAEVPVPRGPGQRAGAKETDGNLLQRLIVAKGVVNPDLSDSRLLSKHECFLPEELVQKVFLPGEINNIAELILEVSGFNDNSVEYAGN